MQGTELRTFGLLPDIEVDKPDSWLDKIFLTFDVDWAHDTVILDSAQVVEELGIRATWFFTHDSQTISLLRKNGHEIGIHPNFNRILSGEDDSNLDSVIEDCLTWCPDAVSTRSHSLVYGAPIASSLASKSVKYSSNLNIPFSSGIALAPWTSSSSVVEVPYSWADEHTWGNIGQPPTAVWAQGSGLLVADFHPIHIFINSQSPADYEDTRFCHQDPSRLIAFRKQGSGVRTELKNLCELMQRSM